MVRSLFVALLSIHLLSGGGCRALHVLVVGGSGRVGGSTVRWLRTLSERRRTPLSVSVGGRRDESYRAAVRNGVLPPRGVAFVPVDVDGDASTVRRTLEGWKASCCAAASSDDDGDADDCLVVHTAGPFQGRRDPTLLSSCLDLSIPYVDVCDEWELAEASKRELDERARDAGIPAVVSCGIWPGVSALMAAEGASQLRRSSSSGEEGGDDVEIESIDYSFFTAGTGNAGPTIVSATFLLLATPVITFLDGVRRDVEPWTERRDVDFGEGVGTKPVWLLDNPDVPTTALYVAKGKKSPDCSSRFGTDPLPWNYLFGAMKALPRSLLYDRDAMQTFSLFSEPIIRLVDRLVGATNAMRVDVTGIAEGGRRERRTLRIAHPDLEQCVGLATAAFALEVAASAKREDEGSATVPPGVWFPVELGREARENILRVAREDSFVYELGYEP